MFGSIVFDHSVLAMCMGGLIGYAAAQHKGYSPVAGIACGVLMGPLFSWALFTVDGIIRSHERERCPHCLEWVNAGASVCARCGNRVVVLQPTQAGGRLRLVWSRRKELPPPLVD